MRVTVDRKQLQRFRARALKTYPQEYIEVVLGENRGDHLVIKKFVQIAHKATKTDQLCSVCGQATDQRSLDYTEDEMETCKRMARDEGLQILGSIHSHPDQQADTYPSDTDNASCTTYDLLLGIMAIWKAGKRKRSSVKWWLPQQSVQDISYS